VPSAGIYLHLGFVVEELERGRDRSRRGASEGEVLVDGGRLRPRPIVERHINASRDLIANRVGVDTRHVHFVGQNSASLVAPRNQIEAVDGLIDECADRFVV
jgi:hypothetical protein